MEIDCGFLLVFIAGGVTGGFIGATHARHFFLGSPHSHRLPDRMREHLRRQLDLTPDQMAKISADRRSDFEQTGSDPSKPRSACGRRWMNRTGRLLLNSPEQRTKLEKMERLHKTEWAIAGSRRPRPVNRATILTATSIAGRMQTVDCQPCFTIFCDGFGTGDQSLRSRSLATGCGPRTAIRPGCGRASADWRGQDLHF